jgi:hypothetical protein
MFGGLQQASAQALYKRIFGDPGCRETYYTGMVPGQFQFQGGLLIWIEVQEWRRLAETDFRQQVFEAAFKENLAFCNAKGIKSAIAVVAIRAPGDKGVMNGWTSAQDRSWRVTFDEVAKVAAEEDAATAQRRAEEEKRRLAQQAAQQAEDAKRKAEQEIVAKQKARTAELSAKADADARERIKSQPSCWFWCEPTEDNARQALQNKLRSFIRQPAIVMNFRKTNGVRAKNAGFDTYELYYQTEIELPEGFLARPQGFWEEMQRGADGLPIATQLKELMNFKITSQSQKWWDPHSLSGAGRVYFRKTEKGWEGFDGRVYEK